jgi:phage gp45-like
MDDQKNPPPILTRVVLTDVANATTDNVGQVIQGTGMVGEAFKKRPLYQMAGVYAIPRDGIAGIMLRQNQMFVMVATADKPGARPSLSDKGDIAVYTDSHNYILIKADGNMEVHSQKDLKLTIQGDVDITTQGQVNINNGALTVSA